MSRPTVRTLATVAVLSAALAGCGDTGELRGAGATATAISPDRLWPDLTPASSPAWDYDDGEAELMRGLAAPGDDIHKVDPVAVVRAEIAQHPDEYTGGKALYAETVRRMADCDQGVAKGRCPVLEPYYRDLTGDGRDDLTLGFELRPGNQTAVRVYTFQAGRLVRVMANDDAVAGVELAGKSVIIRSPSDIAGYEYRFQWTWDPDQHLMLLTHDELLRTGGGGTSSARSSASPAGSLTASPSASPAPSASPSASASASASGSASGR
ncbi:hypothetical protein [Streptomyces resistomycificus]|uniref:Lipoprotein n=1 Tax=Streptomyces resistomycificus TaxID=67356 RepID=A0A0L8LJB9_9ACTN|nr:hypothetical protein [Streptomyces resistomycificus]KOG38200.1 lipoprotein [Streptomyces resistomycificus]